MRTYLGSAPPGMAASLVARSYCCLFSFLCHLLFVLSFLDILGVSSSAETLMLLTHSKVTILHLNGFTTRKLCSYTISSEKLNLQYCGETKGGSKAPTLAKLVLIPLLCLYVTVCVCVLPLSAGQSLKICSGHSLSSKIASLPDLSSCCTDTKTHKHSTEHQNPVIGLRFIFFFVTTEQVKNLFNIEVIIQLLKKQDQKKQKQRFS